GVLLARHREQAVQLALASLGGEELLHVVARDPAAEGERIRPEAARAALDDGGEAHVERGHALPLDLVVVEGGAVLEDDLGHRVGEIRGAGYAAVALHDAGLAALAGDHERARLAEGRR